MVALPPKRNPVQIGRSLYPLKGTRYKLGRRFTPLKEPRYELAAFASARIELQITQPIALVTVFTAPSEFSLPRLHLCISEF